MKTFRLLISLACFVHLLVPLYAQDSTTKEVTLTSDKAQYLFDITEFTVKAGQKVKLTLVVPEEATPNQPHNVVIVKPGTKNTVGQLADESVSDPYYLTGKQAVPDSKDILFRTKLVYPGKTESIEFTAPREAGEYPYLCTFPGHWTTMNGIMKVEAVE